MITAENAGKIPKDVLTNREKGQSMYIMPQKWFKANCK